jgi:UDP-N-acetylglucosamine 4,6-dehydratase
MQDKIIAITGGTGSFGKAMVEELLKKDIKRIRILSRDELKQAVMKDEINDSRVDFFLCDVRDESNLITALEGVDIVIHAAALKRIEKCETNPLEAVKTNIQGSINVANACLKNNVLSAVFISTDKASEPVNLYGASKMVAEKFWIRANCYRGLHHPTKFSVVRYGNVLNSRGSVIPMFKKQAQDRVIRVTHPDMTRFFITLQQAINLVELAVEYAQGGEIYLPQLKSAYITQIAAAVAPEAHIVFTHPNSGEKLHEQLLNQDESKRVTIEDGYTLIHPQDVTWPYSFPKEYSPVVPLTSLETNKFTSVELSELIHNG